MERVQLWATKRISFAGRAQLINSALFGIVSYWASIFLLAAEVLETITKISRNFLWGGTANYSRNPHVSWKTVCLPKKNGGLDIKDLFAWNKAKIAKLIWVLAEKQDILWVKWIHGRYLKNKDWWDYNPP